MRLIGKSEGQRDRSRLYVDRQTHIDALSQALQWQADTPSRPALYWGTGGVGKSTLREMFQLSVLEPRRVPYCVIDYDLDFSLRSAEATLLSIRHQLHSKGLRFPHFDLVWLAYWEKTTGQKATASRLPEELSYLAGVAGVVPVVGAVAQAAVSLAQLGEPIVHSTGKRQARLRELSSMELLHAMPEALAEDIERESDRNANREATESPRITILLDGYENLAAGGTDDWFVRELFGASGRSLKVIFGRDRLSWAETEPEWQGVLLEHRLERLDEEWCREYLDRRGVLDERARESILSISGGHPLYLEVAADLASTILAEHASWPGDLQLDRRIEGLAGQLLDRLLRQLSPSDRDAVLLAAIPRWFTAQVLEALLPDPAAAPRIFSTLSSYSFCAASEEAPDALTIRPELRSLLLDRVRSMDHWSEWNERLAAYHERAALPASFAERVYHALQADPETGEELLWSEFKAALSSWDFTRCYRLIDAVPEESGRRQVQRRDLMKGLLLEHAAVSDADSEAVLPLAKGLEDAPPQIALHAGMLVARVSVKDGRSDDVTALCDRLIELAEEARDAESIVLGRKIRGDCRLYRGDIAGALSDYASSGAGTIELAGGDVTRSIAGFPAGDILRATGGALVRTGAVSEAISVLEPLLAMARGQGSVRMTAELLSELGLAYRRDGRLAEAQEVYEEAGALFEAIGVPISEAHVLCGAGLTAAMDGDLSRGRLLYRDAMSRFEAVGSDSGIAKCLQGFGCIELLDGDYEAADNLLREAETGFRRVRDDVNLWPLLLDSAEAAWRVGNLERSTSLLSEALDLVERWHDSAGACAILIDKGLLSETMGRPQDALTYWSSALERYESSMGPFDISQGSASDQHPEWLNRLFMYEREAQARRVEQLQRTLAAPE